VSDTPSTPAKKRKAVKKPFYLHLEDEMAELLQPYFIQILEKGVKNFTHFHSLVQSKIGTISKPDLKVYLKRCDLMDVFERKQLIQIHMKPTPVDNTYRRPAPPPQISDDEDPDFIPFVRPQPTVVEGLAPPSVSPLVAGDTSGWTPPPDPFGGVPDPMTGAPRNFI